METTNKYKYDVFISSKSEDYPIAEEIYGFLTKNGLSVFLASKELQKIGESEYSKAIDKALDDTTHMIVVASELEYLDSEWVRYEWITFCSDLRSGYRNGNLVTILSDSVELKELPPSLRHRQSFRFGSYQNTILDYLTSDIAISSEEGVINTVINPPIQDSSVLSFKQTIPSIEADISISIPDVTTPIIAFIGPHSVGKTTILFRLIRNLINDGYSIDINKSFRPNNDTVYTKLCDDFSSILNSPIAPPPTSIFGTMLFDFRFHGLKLFQAIDTTGDLFSSKINTLNEIPFSFHCLLNTPNPIIWLIVVDPLSNELDDTYEKTISVIKKNRLRNDKYIIIMNKIETTDLVEDLNNVNSKRLSSSVINAYPKLTQLFRKKNKISSILNHYSCSFAPFQTGNYRDDGHFVQSSDHFPTELYAEILLESQAYLPGYVLSKLNSKIKKLIH